MTELADQLRSGLEASALSTDWIVDKVSILDDELDDGSYRNMKRVGLRRSTLAPSHANLFSST